MRRREAPGLSSGRYAINAAAGVLLGMNFCGGQCQLSAFFGFGGALTLDLDGHMAPAGAIGLFAGAGIVFQPRPSL